MSDDLWFWKYRLKARQPANARTRQAEVEGALVRIGDGFGCLHPRPELGDPVLSRCLEDLAGARRWPLVRRTLRSAKEDADARFLGDPILEEIDVPDSHATLPWHDARIVASAVEQGFDRVKMKLGANLEQEAAFLAEQAAAYPQLLWRLDFNEVPEPEEVAVFLRELPQQARRRIDFLEDPCPYSESTWQALRREHRIPLAINREAGPQCAAAQVVVIKPAVDEPWLLAEAAVNRGQKLVVTSYMEHPLGQVSAAWEAAKLNVQFPGALGICGLQTHQLFTPCEFSERLGRWAPGFHSPGGTGFGFDDLLEKLPWKRI